MNTRRTRGKAILGLESLEIRTAPSHVSALAHAVPLVHVATPTAHVEKLHESHESKTSTDTDSSNDGPSSTTEIHYTNPEPKSPDVTKDS
jgi:hypothetical protein